MRLLCVVAVLVLSACASTPVPPETVAAANEPLVCTSKEQCDRYWQRSLSYLSTYAPYRIQIVNDYIIQTYRPTNYAVDSGYVVTRENLGDGQQRIRVLIGCANPIRCQPDIRVLAAQFKRYVKGGGM